MDTSRFKRRATQIQRQHKSVNNRPFAYSAPVPKEVSVRSVTPPQRIVQPQQPAQAPALPRLSGEAMSRLRSPHAAVQPAAPTPSPAPQVHHAPKTHHVSHATQPVPIPVMPVAQPAVAPKQKQPTVTVLKPIYETKPQPSVAVAPNRLESLAPQPALAQLEPVQPAKIRQQPVPVMRQHPVAAAPAPEPQFRPALSLNMDLPEAQVKENRLKRAVRNLRETSLKERIANLSWRGARRYAFRGVAVALVLVITLGGLLFSQGYLKAHKAFQGTAGTAAALKANVDPDMLKGEGAGRVNVLLLGRGGPGHDGADLTDTMMVVSVDPVNHTSTLLSIPRDLWVQVPGGGPMKINAAWETGEFKYTGKINPGSTDPKAIKAGFDTVDGVVQTALGINIDYNVIVNFQAFQQAIDTVGGVAVDVPTDLVDPTMAWENNNDPVLAHAGAQNFSGTTALKYVRSRETSSDFARAQRQRAVMMALKNKVETVGTLSNPLKISGLINAFGDNVSSDLSISNANRLYGILKGIDDAHTTSVGFNDDNQSKYVTTTSIKGQSVVVPTAGQFQYTALQDYVHSQIKDPYIMKEGAKVIVLNGTLLPGIASKQGDQLKSYGYNVVASANTPNSGWTQTTLVDLTHGKDKYTKNYLEQRYGVKAVNKLQDNTIPTNGADFVIIIGSNEIDNPQN